VKRILFVCVENSNRSQMAEAFARIHGAGRVEPSSAGSRPSGRVNPRAIAAMQELGYDLTTHSSKGLEAFNGADVEVAITMGCGEEFREVRNLIEAKVRELIQSLESPAARPAEPGKARLSVAVSSSLRGEPG
jgi:arsenate reductase